MTNEIYDSILTLYYDVLNDDITRPYLDSRFSSPDQFNHITWTFSSINNYRNHTVPCTITVNFDAFTRHVNMLMVDYDLNTVCVWTPPENKVYAQWVLDTYPDCLEYDFNIAMAIARDGFFDSGYDSKEKFDEEVEDFTVDISLDLTDSELALIARAAHNRDMKINDFMVEAVKMKLSELGVE